MTPRSYDDPAPLLCLHERDTVGSLPRSLPAGARVSHGATEWSLAAPLGLGHKVALVATRGGDKVIKFGVAIGSASRDIAAGEHVHLHNLQSDYLPTFTLAEGGRYGA